MHRIAAIKSELESAQVATMRNSMQCKQLILTYNGI